ncbi:LysR family transcriptional regulator [Pigmentiphaga aceris]|uniref:LysR family transcriptional regulator n=1 Tax=Pigmentiphaga aceris TaxID=1940612 RepID=A0A5C0B374_9BURK|nr:LysR family transcriptional regulator [Pigmentiphaga aceris]
MNMRHVEAFRAVMISGSVVGAAKLLDVTQPGVSRTISLLEMRLGYELFERRGRRLVPTAEAEALYREVEQSYVGIERINQAALDIRFHRAGALRIATLPALGQWVVPRAIADFLDARPKVTVFVQTLNSRQIAELVATRQFDLGVVELPLSRAGTEVHPLPPSRMVAVMPIGHRLADRSILSLKDLADERMVLHSHHSYVRYQIDDAYSKLGIAPNVVVETPTSSIACALAAAGTGVTLVARWTALPLIGTQVAAIPIQEMLHSQYGIIVPADTRPMTLASEFAALLADYMSPEREAGSLETEVR